MKLTKVSGGWLVEPHTSDEARHLSYLLEGLVNQPKVAAEATGCCPATRSPLCSRDRNTAETEG